MLLVLKTTIMLTVACMSIMMTQVVLAQSAGHKPAQSAGHKPAQSAGLTPPKTPAATSTAAAPKAPSPTSGWSVGLSLEYSENVTQVEGGPKQSGMELLLAPGYKINDTFSTLAKASIIRESTGDKKPTISNTQVGLSMKGWKLSESITSLHSASVVLPTSQTARETDRLYSALGISNGLTMSFHPRFDMNYKLGLSRNIHEFTINAEGAANVEYRLSHTLELKLVITDQLNLTSIGVYRQGRTYQGFERQDFQFHGDINYDMTETFSMNVGTSNEGPAMKASGIESNISVFDEKSTVWRIGLSANI